MQEKLTYPFGTINYIPRRFVPDNYSTEGYITWPSIREVWLTYRWSACVWRHGYRCESNFMFADYCVLDFDEGMTIRQAVENVFADFSMLIGTTENHQREKGDAGPCDRFRVVIPFERRITDVEEYRYNIEKLIHEYGADDQCKDAAHAFKPCRKTVHTQHGGAKLPVGKPPEDWFAKQYELLTIRCQETKVISRDARILLAGRMPTGERNRLTFKGAKDLAKAGMSGEEILQEIKTKQFYIEADKNHQKAFERSVTSAIHSLLKDRKKLHDRQCDANR